MTGIREIRKDLEPHLGDTGIAGVVARQIHEKGMRSKDGREMLAQILRRWEPNPRRSKSSLFGLCLAHLEGDESWRDACLDWQERTGLTPREWREQFLGGDDD